MSKPFETELISSSFDETYKTLVKQYQEQKSVNDLQEHHLTVLDGEIERVDERIDGEHAERVAEVARLDERIDTEHAERVAEIERVETESADNFQTKAITPVVVASVTYSSVDSAITAIADNMNSGSVTRAELDAEVNTINNRIDAEVNNLDDTITTLTGAIENEKQNKTLDNPLPLPLGTQTDVEGALGGLSVQEQIDTGNLSNSIAQDFSTRASYAVGDYVMKDKLLYKCATAHQGEWEDADFSLVKVVDEMGGGSPAPTPATELYDYVITNQSEFDDWQHNHNDGTETVAILAGTYTCSAQEGKDYAIFQPKELKGFGEVIINCTATYGAKGDNDNTKKIENVTVNCTGEEQGKGVAFCRCANIWNCYGEGTTGRLSSGFGFEECINIVSCKGTGKGSSVGEAFGFKNCDNLSNCIGTGISGVNGIEAGFKSCNNLYACAGTSNNEGYGTGFDSCTNLSFCTGEGIARGYTDGWNTYATGYGFKRCKGLHSCIGIGIGGTEEINFNAKGYGFFKCNNLTSCTGTGESKSNNMGSVGRGFDSCSYMTQCQGQGLRGTNGSGKAFGDCTAMTYCKASGHCTDEVATVTSCSSSPTYNATYQVANTLNGGWNDLTNPA